jgi:peptide/nickel transport system ATP-binding protein
VTAAVAQATAAPPLLEIDGLSISTRTRFHVGKAALGARPILRDVTLQIPDGRFVALVGESGSGKSLIGRAVLGLLPRTRWAVTGRIAVGGERVFSSTDGPADTETLRRLRRDHIAAVFQEPTSYLNPSLPIGRQLAERAARGEVPPLAAALQTVGLVPASMEGLELAADYLGRYPHQLSPGQQQRVMLAIALAIRTVGLVVADEPTAALDASIQKAIVAVFGELRRAGHLRSLLLVTHDLRLVRALLTDPEDMTYFLARDEGVEAGPSQRPYRVTHDLPTRDLFGGAPDTLPPAVRAQLEVARSCRAEPPRAPDPGATPKPEVHVGIRELVQSYPGGLFGKAKVVLRVEALDIRRGETLGIVGESGCGKSTLVRAIARLLGPPERGGRIEYRDASGATSDLIARQPDGTVPDTPRMAALRPEIQIIFQDAATSFNPVRSVGAILHDTVEMVAAHGARPAADVRDELERDLVALNLVGRPEEVAALADALPDELSAGQRQRLALARALATHPALLIADEPFTNVDRTTTRDMVSLLERKRRERTMTIVIISHDLSLVLEACDRIVVMGVLTPAPDVRFGGIVATGTPAEILANDDPEVRRLLDAVLPL